MKRKIKISEKQLNKFLNMPQNKVFKKRLVEQVSDNIILEDEIRVMVDYCLITVNVDGGNHIFMLKEDDSGDYIVKYDEPEDGRPLSQSMIMVATKRIKELIANDELKLAQFIVYSNSSPTDVSIEVFN